MSEIRAANAPCSWGVLEFDLEGGQSGFETVLDEMAQAGYEGTELGDWGFMPTDPPALSAELNKRNLSMLGAFVPVALSDPDALERGIQSSLRVAKLLAGVAESPFVVLADDNGTVDERTRNAGRVQPAMGLREDQWIQFARGAERVARSVLDETGVRTVFHHHCAGYVETPYEIDTLMRLTDPGLLGLCFDTGHCAFGGGDPLDTLRRHWNRIWHVHFKDCEPDVAERSRKEGWDYFESVRNGVFCELGKGTVPFADILGEMKNRGYKGWVVVEQDVLPGMGSPFESAKRNREFLNSIGLW